MEAPGVKLMRFAWAANVPHQPHVWWHIAGLLTQIPIVARTILCFLSLAMAIHGHGANLLSMDAKARRFGLSDVAGVRSQ